MNQYKEIDDYVVRYKAGDKAAGELLVMTFKPLVLSTMAKVYVSPEDQEDAFQDGIYAFLEGIGKFNLEHGAGFNAFIKTHLWQFYLKRQSGRYHCSIEADKSLDENIPNQAGQTLEDTLVDESIDIEGQYIEGEVKKVQHHQLKMGWQILSKNEKEVVTAHYVAKCSLKKIARDKDLSFSTIQSYHNRALKKLKKYF